MSYRAKSSLAALVLAAMITAAGCGAPGAPVPPSLQLPKPVSDLSASRKGNNVFLNWTPPTQTADGENIRHAGRTKVCRAITDSRAIGCDEKVGELTDAQVEHWTAGTMASRHDYTDTLPESLQQQNPSGVAIYALMDLNPDGRDAGLSNQVRVPLAPTLPAPKDLKAQVTANGVELSWAQATPTADPGVRYLYRVYRREMTSPKKPESVVGEAPIGPGEGNHFIDSSIEWQHQYSYHADAVTEVEKEGKQIAEVEGEDSPEVEVLAQDVFPPTVPTGVQAVYSGIGQKPFVDLTWAPNLERDLAGYNVYRHEQTGPSARINSELVKSPAYRDAGVESGHAYSYSVSAVDLRGNESGKSEETSEQVP